MSDSEIKVSLKYCGSCNPLIDLPKIGNELKEAIGKEKGLRFASADSDDIDAIIILCGCPRACGNKEATRAKAKRSIVVAGETIDLAPIAEKDISTEVMKKLKSTID